MANLYLMRHAEPTHYNLDTKKYLMADEGSLTDQGVNSLRQISEPCLKDVSMVFISRQKRAIDSVSVLKNVGLLNNARFFVHFELNPRSWGIWERMPLSILPDYIISSLNTVEFCPPQGESRKDVAIRLYNWYVSVLIPLLDTSDEKILVVTHSKIIDMIVNLRKMNEMSFDLNSILAKTGLKTNHAEIIPF